jgi:hypothetical protein
VGSVFLSEDTARCASSLATSLSTSNSELSWNLIGPKGEKDVNDHTIPGVESLGMVFYGSCLTYRVLQYQRRHTHTPTQHRRRTERGEREREGGETTPSKKFKHACRLWKLRLPFLPVRVESSTATTEEGRRRPNHKARRRGELRLGSGSDSGSG